MGWFSKCLVNIGIFLKIGQVQKTVSKRKLKHCKRVAEKTKKLKKTGVIYSAAAHHDFLEVGWDYAKLKKRLPEEVMLLVGALTNIKNIDTLKNLQNNLVGKEQQFIDDVIIIKLCDRSDNIKTRFLKKCLRKSYVKKTGELVQWLWDNYKGDDKEKIKDFIEDHIMVYAPSLELMLHLE